MGACTFSLIDAGRLEKTQNAMVDTGAKPQCVIGLLTMPASYDSGGSVLDLSAYFSKILQVNISDEHNGLKLEYIKATGGAPATGKVKAFNAVAAHTHSLPVTGGGSAASTKALYAVTNALTKEEAANTTVTVPANTVAAASDEASGNLSTYTANVIAWGLPV